jgi:hypothetical protein
VRIRRTDEEKVGRSGFDNIHPEDNIHHILGYILYCILGLSTAALVEDAADVGGFAAPNHHNP